MATREQRQAAIRDAARRVRSGEIRRAGDTVPADPVSGVPLNPPDELTGSPPAETYTVTRLKCDNCGWDSWPNREKIPQGRTVPEHPCPECGCKKLRRAV